MKKRFLCFRGGGVFGYWGARVCTHIHDCESDVLFKADFYAGTSTGAILAGCAVLGMPFNKVMGFYTDRAAEVFSRGWWRKLTSPFGGRMAKYPNEPIRRILAEVIDGFAGRQITLGDVRKSGKHVGIVAIKDFGDQFGTEPVFITSMDTFWDAMPLSEAIAISCCEPYYFDPIELPGWGLFTGGGLAGNDPTERMVGRAARATMDLEPVILGVGTGDPIIRIPPGSPGLISWAPHFIQLALDISVEGVEDDMKAGYGDRYYMMNDREMPDGAMDDVGMLPAMASQADKYDNKEVLQFLRTEWQ